MRKKKFFTPEQEAIVESAEATIKAKALLEKASWEIKTKF